MFCPSSSATYASHSLRSRWPVMKASLYQTALVDYTLQNTLAFITGQRDLSEWDAYVAELEGQNMSAYVDIVNGAQQRYAEENGRAVGRRAASRRHARVRRRRRGRRDDDHRPKAQP